MPTVGSVISIAPAPAVFTLRLRQSLSTLRLRQQCTQHQDPLEYIASAPAVCAAQELVVQYMYAEDRGRCQKNPPYNGAFPLCSLFWSVCCQKPFHAPRVFTVRHLPGQIVREEDLVQNAVRCFNELRSGSMPQQGGRGAHASVVEAALGRFHCGVRRMCAEQPTADDRTVLIDLLGGIDPHRVESSGFTLLVERLLSLPAQLLTRLLAEAPRDFWTLEFSKTDGCVFAALRANLCFRALALPTAASFTKLEIQPGGDAPLGRHSLPDRAPSGAPKVFLSTHGEEARARDHLRGGGACRRHDAHFPAVQSYAGGVVARAGLLPDHPFSDRPYRRASVTWRITSRRRSVSMACPRNPL